MVLLLRGSQALSLWLVAVDSVTKDLLSFHVKRKIQTIMQLVGRIQPPSIPFPSIPFTIQNLLPLSRRILGREQACISYLVGRLGT